jgi:hypothetical protein
MTAKPNTSSEEQGFFISFVNVGREQGWVGRALTYRCPGLLLFAPFRSSFGLYDKDNTAIVSA